MATITAAAGGGNWTAGGTWVGGVAPTAADDAVLGPTSGNVTIDAGAVCRSLDCTGYTGVLTHTAATDLTIGDGTAGAGNIALKLVNGMTYTLGGNPSSGIRFVSTAAGVQTVNYANKTVGNQTFQGAGSSYQLVSAMTLATTGTVTLTAGTLDTNGQSCSWGLFNSNNSNVRTLTLGASNITITGTGTSWSLSTITNLTFNPGSSTITMTGSGPTIAAGALTYNNMVIAPSVSSTAALGGGPIIANLSVTPAAGLFVALTVTANTTVPGLLTITGSASGSTIGRVLISRNSVSTGVTTNLNAGSVALTNVDFMDINATGAAIPWSGTSVGDGGGNTNINFQTSRTLYWIGNGGNHSDGSKWSLSSGGAGASTTPLPQDDIIFDANSFNGAGQTLSMAARIVGRNVDFSNVTNNPIITTAGTNYIFGSLTLKAGMTTSAAAFTFCGRGGSMTLTSAGCTLGAITLGVSTGSIALQDNLNLGSNALNLTSGTFSVGANNVTALSFNGSNSNTRTLNMGSGTWTLTGTGTVWTNGNSASMTFNAQTSTLIISDTSATGKLISMGGGSSKNLYNLTLPAGGGAVTIDLNGIAALGTLTITGPKSIIVNVPSANGITAGAVNMRGTAGNLITWTSSAPGTSYAFLVSSGIVSCDYLSLQDNHASGGATFYAGSHSTDVSGNTGWSFTDAPVASGGNLNLMGVG